jgi:hypothetical protein
MNDCFDKYWVDAYRWAKEYVIAQGYSAEIRWQCEASFEAITESQFLSEAAWVILSCGMRETVISRKFPLLSTAFLEWDSSGAILRRKRNCRDAALRIFAHEQKIDAILRIIEVVRNEGLEEMKKGIRSSGVAYLQRFPFLGPATSYHLAKNLGIDVVKPDRHLLRITAIAGFDSPERFCRYISDAVGDKSSVVDVVLWRFATLHQCYLQLFRRGPIH